MSNDRAPLDIEPSVIALGVIAAFLLLGMIIWLAL
jgi:hypothetical protein